MTAALTVNDQNHTVLIECRSQSTADYLLEKLKRTSLSFFVTYDSGVQRIEVSHAAFYTAMQVVLDDAGTRRLYCDYLDLLDKRAQAAELKPEPDLGPSARTGLDAFFPVYIYTDSPSQLLYEAVGHAARHIWAMSDRQVLFVHLDRGDYERAIKVALSRRAFRALFRNALIGRPSEPRLSESIVRLWCFSFSLNKAEMPFETARSLWPCNAPVKNVAATADTPGQNLVLAHQQSR